MKRPDYAPVYPPLDRAKCFMLVVLPEAERASQCTSPAGWDVAAYDHGYIAIHDLDGGWCRQHAAEAAAEMNIGADVQAHEPKAIRPTDRRWA